MISELLAHQSQKADLPSSTSYPAVDIVSLSDLDLQSIVMLSGMS